jgi:hypothetical protein
LYNGKEGFSIDDEEEDDDLGEFKSLPENKSTLGQ